MAEAHKGACLLHVHGRSTKISVNGKMGRELSWPVGDPYECEFEARIDKGKARVIIRFFGDTRSSLPSHPQHRAHPWG